MVTVRIPTQLRNLSGNAAEVAVEGATVADMLKTLKDAQPGFEERLLDDTGGLQWFVNRFLQGVDTPVADGQTLSIVPAVAGG